MFPPPQPGVAANVSAETHAHCDAVAAWGRAQWPDVRVIREMALGARRVDVLFVMASDLVGVEIKGPKDSTDRLAAQLTEYRYWLPLVYAALDVKFKDKTKGVWIPNLLWIDGQVVTDEHAKYSKWKPHRDDLCCSRLLDLLWRDEAAAVAVRTGVIPGRVPKQFNRGKILSMLARLLTGHDIVKQVCRELRARQLVGMGSDLPMRTEDTNGKTTGTKTLL